MVHPQDFRIIGINSLHGSFSVSDTDDINPTLISIATGAGVLCLLLIICLTIVCRRKKHMSRAMAIPPPRPRPDLGDHAVLVRQPDRLALIAFAEGLQNGQVSFCSYVFFFVSP